jgi:hypothetical protein
MKSSHTSRVIEEIDKEVKSQGEDAVRSGNYGDFDVTLRGDLADVFLKLEGLAQPAIDAKDAAGKQALEKYRGLYDTAKKEKGVTCAFEGFAELCELVEAWPIKRGKDMCDPATQKRILDDEREAAIREDRKG